MLGGFFNGVQVVALLATAGFSVGLEQLFELVKQVCFGAEVGEVFTIGQGGGHGFLHRAPLVAVVAVALHHCRCDSLALKNVLKGALDSAGACAGGTGDRNNRVTLRHAQESTKLTASLAGRRRLPRQGS